MTWLLYESGEIELEELLKLLIPSFDPISPLFGDDKEALGEIQAEDLIIAYCPLGTLRTITQIVTSKEAVLAVLPRDDNALFTQAFSIPKKVDAAVQMVTQTKPSKVDLLYVNGLPVFSHVTIGEMSHFWPKNGLRKERILPRWYTAFKKSLLWLKHLRFQSFSMTTAKEQHIQTAAAGITLIENSNSPLLRHVLKEQLDAYDGQLNAFIWSPRSVIALIWNWIRLVIFGKIPSKALPASIGIIQTKTLTITSPLPIAYTIDGTELGCYTFQSDVLPAVLKIIQGNISDTVSMTAEYKESFKVAHLPHGDSVQELVSEPLPLFSHAGEEEFRDLFLQLRQSATPGNSFFILMILSTILAAMGLFLNSSSVIIGAMILAPLMAPIISLSMATARNNRQLMGQSLFVLGSGIAVSIAIAALISAVMPLELITDEMRSRLHPNLLDLVVAIASGIAGAYAYSREDITKSLPGVAIAVALIPPLTVTGIGLGFADWQMVSGSFLLFITNLIGIIIAASATFLFLGFAPLRMARKGLGVTALLLVAIIPPLMFGFFSMTLQSDIAKRLINQHFISGEVVATVENAMVIQSNPLELSLKLSVNEPLTSFDCDLLKEKISKVLQKELSLRLSYEIIR